MARVLFLDPYHGPSHRALSTALRDRSRHDVTLLTLPPRKWKWRMRGAALAFESVVRALPAAPELLVCTDMLNLPEFLALLRDALPPRLPVITYFHENQITYPLPARDERDFHFGLANIYTALASGKVVFNSAFHRDEFLAAVPGVLKAMPDFRPDGVPERIAARSEVLGPPVEAPAPPAALPVETRRNLILWNHRWEEDKDPETFFRVMGRLERAGADFRMVVLGESFRGQPGCFAAARRDLAHRIERWGWLESRDEYLREVSRCRAVVSTARHEFFGLAVREAIVLGCYPLLPRRVVYPELVGGRREHLYDSEDDLLERLLALLASPADAPSARTTAALRSEAASPGAAEVVARWDQWFDSLT
jgi:glycosyltransferase involved in cell wall biosynthesis